MQQQVPSRTITTALASAFHEWFLIFLLLIDASFSYLITKFARYYHLQVPCILCSRIDHVLRNENKDFCWDLLCKKHKVKISSLVLCSLHQTLVDVHDLCENCLFSFATVNKSNAETYRLLVGKLGDEPHRGSSDFNGGRRQCSCCNEELVTSSTDQKVFDKMSVKHEAVELDKPFLATDGQDIVEPIDTMDMSLSRNVRDFLGKDDDIDLLPLATDGQNTVEPIDTMDVTLSRDAGDFSGKNDDIDLLPLATDGQDTVERIDIMDVTLSRDAGDFSGKNDDIDLLPLATDGQDIVEPIDTTDMSLSRDARGFLGEDDDVDLLQHVEYQKVNIASDDDSDCSEARLTKFDQQDLNDADDTEKLSLIDDLALEKLSLIDDLSSEKKPRSGKDDDDDLLPHVGYQKVNIASDTESKASLSDDESVCSGAHLTKFDDRDLNAADFTEKASLIDDLPSGKLIHPAIVIEPYFLDSKVEVKNGNLHRTESPELIKFGIEDEDLNSSRAKPESSIFEHDEVSEIVSESGTLTEKLIHPTVVIEPSLMESTMEVKNSNWHGAESPEPSRYSIEELNCPQAEPESGICDHNEASQIHSVSGTLTSVGEPSKDETVRNGETRTLSKIVSSNDRLIVFKPPSSDNPSQIPNILELSDAYKLAIGSRGRQLSGKLLEQLSLKESTKLSDDLKFLLSQLSFVRGNDLSSCEVSPRVSGMQILQRRASLERNISGISLDESIISEIEGENLVDRLKRQVDHDRKIMSSLYKELEEERNASTVAVNEAMAMITRLQEEKSSLQMEALQCLRMMEEQAEYDNENLQKANDIIAQKEKETQDLESELEFYKKKLSALSPTDNKTEEKFEMDVQEHEEDSSKESNTENDL